MVGKAVANVRVSVVVFVARVGRLEGRGGGDGVDADIAVQNLVEHGTAFARLDVQHHL
jgi:hypothetical protein